MRQSSGTALHCLHISPQRTPQHVLHYHCGLSTKCDDPDAQRLFDTCGPSQIQFCRCNSFLSFSFRCCARLSILSLCRSKHHKKVSSVVLPPSPDDRQQQLTPVACERRSALGETSEDYTRLCASKAAQDTVLAQMQAVAKEARLKVCPWLYTASQTCPHQVRNPTTFCITLATSAHAPSPLIVALFNYV